jgi:hypothetical protein
VNTTLRLVQVFLSPAVNPGPGIFEVYSDTDGGLHCSCPLFLSKKICKHTRFVRAKTDANNGTYPLEVSSRATTEEAQEAQKSTEAFRDFIIKFGKIEVY